MATQIKATNREFLEILKALEAVKQAKGKSFAVLAARNIVAITEHLRPIEEVALPKKAFVELSEKVQRLIQKEDQEAVTKLEQENEELIEERKAQLLKVEEMLDEKASVKINMIREEIVPEEVTAEQLLPLLKILKD